MTRDNSKMQVGQLWTEYLRRYWVKDDFTEPYRSHQNPAERAMSIQKEKIERLFIDTGCDPKSWYRAMCHVADINNNTAVQGHGYRIPLEIRDGDTPDISGLLLFKFWEKVYFENPTHSFPEVGGNEKLGRWLGRANSYGDKMCYWILDVETEQLLVRSGVRSAEHTTRPNRGLDESSDDKDDDDDKKNHDETIIVETVNEEDSDAEELNEEDLETDSKPKAKGTCPIVTYYGNQATQEFAGTPNIKKRHEVVQFDPEDLIDLYVYDSYTNSKKGQTKMRGKVTDRINDTS